jgi:hypothetical protein
LRVVSFEQMICECKSADPGHRCPNAASYGSGFFCRVLWKSAPGKL